MLAVDALHGHQWGFLLLEATWAVVSAYALVRRAPRRGTTSSDLGRTRRATRVGEDRVMDRHQIELPAGTIHYREGGPADGRPVVFVHGFLVDDTLWSDVPERLAERGFHTFAPTWPLGSHTTAMNDGADLSPRGVARVVASFLEAHDLQDVVLVGSDTGGAVSQLLLDEDPSRIGRLVLTNCDAFDTFPPFPFGALFRLGRHPGPARRCCSRCGRRSCGTASSASAGWFAVTSRPRRAGRGSRRTSPTRAYVATSRRSPAGWRPDELADSPRWLAKFDQPVLLCWAPGDPFFKYDLAKRLLGTFPDATLVEFRGARTFVSLDQPERLADEIVALAGSRCRCGPGGDTSAVHGLRPAQGRVRELLPQGRGPRPFSSGLDPLHRQPAPAPGASGVDVGDVVRGGCAAPLASKVTPSTEPGVAAGEFLHVGEGVFGPGVLRGAAPSDALDASGS